MRVRSVVALASLLIAGVAVPAAAQQAPQRNSGPLRGYLTAGAGAVFGLPQASPTFSGEIAERVRPNLFVYLAANYFENVITDEALDDLAAAGTLLRTETGLPWEFSGRDRARSVTLGVKYLAPTATSLHPYIGGGFGVLNLRRTIVERNRGDITETFFSEFGAPDGAVDPAQTNTNRPMGEIAAGIGVAVKRAYVDVGYRYRRAFHTANNLALSQIGVSAGLRF
jgi:hypothetical protein